jgi:hypothetical protein
MAFQDKSVRCSSCGAAFTFSADEQGIYQSWGFANEPSAAIQGGQSDVGMVAITKLLSARCSWQHVLIVVKMLMYRLNLVLAGEYIAAIATAR